MKKMFGLVLGLVTLTSGAFAAEEAVGTSNVRGSMYRRTSDNITVVNNFKFSGRAPNGVMAQPMQPVKQAKQQPIKEMPQYQPVKYNRINSTCGAWYVGGRVNLSMLSWENEYSSTYPALDLAYDHDKYSFEPIYGGAFTVGYAFDTAWRLDIEAGIMGRFEDNDEGVNFTLTVPYVIANAYNDFYNGMYVGVGLGLAVPKTELDGEHTSLVFEGGHRTKRQGSLMGAAMIGYAYDFDQHLTLDVRYRLAALNGTRHETTIIDASDNRYDFRNKIGLILDNSVSVGLRYRF